MTTPSPGRTVRALFSRMHCCQQSTCSGNRAVPCIIIGPIMHCTARSASLTDGRSNLDRRWHWSFWLSYHVVEWLICDCCSVRARWLKLIMFRAAERRIFNACWCAKCKEETQTHEKHITWVGSLCWRWRVSLFIWLIERRSVYYFCFAACVHIFFIYNKYQNIGTRCYSQPVLGVNTVEVTIFNSFYSEYTSVTNCKL